MRLSRNAGRFVHPPDRVSREPRPVRPGRRRWQISSRCAADAKGERHFVLRQDLSSENNRFANVAFARGYRAHRTSGASAAVFSCRRRPRQASAAKSGKAHAKRWLGVNTVLEGPIAVLKPNLKGGNRGFAPVCRGYASACPRLGVGYGRDQRHLSTRSNEGSDQRLFKRQQSVRNPPPGHHDFWRSANSALTALTSLIRAERDAQPSHRSRRAKQPTSARGRAIMDENHGPAARRQFLRAIFMADFFSNSNEWTDEGAVRLDFHHKRRAFAENEIPPVTPCQQGKSLPAALERSHKSLVFHLVERICSCGWERRNREIIPPVRPMNRRDREGSAKRKTHFMGPLESATIRISKRSRRCRSRRTFCVRITPYLLDFTT